MRGVAILILTMWLVAMTHGCAEPLPVRYRNCGAGRDAYAGGGPAPITVHYNTWIVARCAAY